MSVDVDDDMEGLLPRYIFALQQQIFDELEPRPQTQFTSTVDKKHHKKHNE